jgi:hypothetical protein
VIFRAAHLTVSLEDQQLELQTRLKQWMTQDHDRVRALSLVEGCALRYSMPQWCIAAGFVRNLVWDRLHGFAVSPLNDIDVIYFCPLDMRPERDLAIETYLRERAPDLPWSVKNQARMHLRNHDAPYASCIEAMAHWPELETAVGVYCQSDNVECHGMAFNSSLEWEVPFGNLFIRWWPRLDYILYLS